MDMNSKKVKFDPGYAPVVIDALGAVGYIYYTFCAIRDLKLKKINFPHTLRKLEKNLEINIGFYLGCLLWACYIKQFSDFEIEGNQLLGEVCEEKEYTGEINFLIDFVKNQLPRDSKYYLNKNYEPDKRYLPVLETYKEFLILNRGFVDVSNTNQIKIPENIKKPNQKELDLINENIQNAIVKKDITKLFDCFSMIL